jgi:hypothetical protein
MEFTVVIQKAEEGGFWAEVPGRVVTQFGAPPPAVDDSPCT